MVYTSALHRAAFKYFWGQSRMNSPWHLSYAKQADILWSAISRSPVCGFCMGWCRGVTACACSGSCSSLQSQGQTQRLVLLTCPKQSIYLCSHSDAPAKLAALIISALSLQAFRAVWNINFASLQVSKGLSSSKVPNLQLNGTARCWSLPKLLFSLGI